MAQVFGADEALLILSSSLWVEADYIGDVEAHEAALAGAGFEKGSLPTKIDQSGFHPRGQVWGQHLTSSPTHHTWVVARVANPDVDPNSREADVGGRLRYSVEVHSVPKTDKHRASSNEVWIGNNVSDFVNGKKRHAKDVTWPDVQRMMKRGPRR